MTILGTLLWGTSLVFSSFVGVYLALFLTLLPKLQSLLLPLGGSWAILFILGVFYLLCSLWTRCQFFARECLAYERWIWLDSRRILDVLIHHLLAVSLPSLLLISPHFILRLVEEGMSHDWRMIFGLVWSLLLLLGAILAGLASFYRWIQQSTEYATDGFRQGGRSSQVIDI